MDLSSLTPLPGGWSGETFLAEAAGERSVVRIYPPGSPRGPAAAEIDAAVLRLVRGLVPVPEVLEVRPAEPGGDHPGLLITSFMPGMRADELLPTLAPGALEAVGTLMGGLVADLGGMPMTRSGPFVDASLAIGSFGPDDGLQGWVASHELGLAHLTPQELDGLREVAVEADVLLDTVTRVCLVHSDLNPKNLLLDPGSLALTAVLDWEFAHAGHPFTDLGNLLRFERHATFTAAVLDAYAARRGVTPAAALALARTADLWALVDLSTRRTRNPVAARADRLLRAIARERDPGASEPT